MNSHVDGGVGAGDGGDGLVSAMPSAMLRSGSGGAVDGALCRAVERGMLPSHATVTHCIRTLTLLYFQRVHTTCLS